MSVLTAEQLARWRAHPQRAYGNLVMWVPDLVFTCTVNQATFGYPTYLVEFDSPVGAAGDVEAGMLVKVYTAAGVYKGFTRVLKPISGISFYVHPVGRGDLDFANNDRIEVYEFYLPYALIPYIDPNTGTLYKDYNTPYSDQTDEFPPVCNVTVDRNVDTVDPVSGVITVQLSAVTSYEVADGSSIASYLWNLKDGTTSILTNPTITATFPAGQRWVTCTVTDSNGQTAIRRVPIFAADGVTYKFYQARFSRRGYQSGIGWELSVELLDPDLSDIPDHALVLFQKDDWFGPHRGSLTGSTTGFFGWITSEELRMEPLWSDCALNAQGPLAILQQRPAFVQTVRRDATPATWAEVKGLDWWKTIVYLLKFHSNLLELVNLERPAFYNQYAVPRLDSEAGTLYDQLDFLARANFCALTCDQTGALYFRRVPHFMNSTERAACTPVAALSAADLVGDGQGPRFERPHWDALAWMRASALLADDDTSVPLLAIAPGTTPGQGPQIDSLDRILVLSQSDFNERAGHVYAYRQSRRDGARVLRRGDVVLAGNGDVFDPAWQEVFTLTLDASSNRRGFVFDAARMVPTELDVAIDHENGVSLPRLSVEQETRGAPATTEAVPTTTVNDMPPQDYEPTAIIEPLNATGSGLKSAVMALDIGRGIHGVTKRGGVYYTNNLLTGPWAELMGGLPVVDTVGCLRPIYINLDPYDPDTAIFISRNGGLYINHNWKTGGSWEEVYTNDEMLAICSAVHPEVEYLDLDDAAFSMAEQGTLYFVQGGDDYPFVVQIKDYGDTVNVSPRLKAPSAVGFTTSFKQLSVQASNTDGDVVYACGVDESYPDKTSVWKATWGDFPTDGGRWVPNWNQDSDNPVATVYLFVPYKREDGVVNNPETEVYLLGYNKALYKSDDGADSFALWSPTNTWPGVPFGGGANNMGFCRDTMELVGSPQQVAFFISSSNDVEGVTPDKIHVCTGLPASDSDNWSAFDTPYTGILAWAGGWPFADGQFYIAAGTPASRRDPITDLMDDIASGPYAVLYVTQDGAQTWTDLTHNLKELPSFTPESGFRWAMVRMTPHWTER